MPAPRTRLNGNGNGIANEANDGQIAQQRGFSLDLLWANRHHPTHTPAKRKVYVPNHFIPPTTVLPTSVNRCGNIHSLPPARGASPLRPCRVCRTILAGCACSSQRYCSGCRWRLPLLWADEQRWCPLLGSECAWPTGQRLHHRQQHAGGGEWPIQRRQRHFR